MEIQQIDAHIEKHEKLQSAKASKKSAKKTATKQTAAAKLGSVCEVYQKVRPVILFAKGLLFFKPKWQAVIQQLIDSLDLICPPAA